MMAAREKTQADFDLERFIEMFDEALTSKDERVINALQSLMMMVILTKSESRTMSDRDVGPLRQMYDDLHNLNRRLHDTEERVRSIDGQLRNRAYSDRDLHAKDYWERQTQYKWSAIDAMPLPTMTEEDYKRVARAIRNINTPGKL